MKRRHLTLEIFLLIVAEDLLNMFAQVILKKGIIATGISPVTFANTADFIIKNVASPILWLGIALYILNFFLWIVILYKVDLSIAMPLGGLSYVFAPFAAMIFLHEEIGLFRWIGIALIVAGVHFISRSGRPDCRDVDSQHAGRPVPEELEKT